MLFGARVFGCVAGLAATRAVVTTAAASIAATRGAIGTGAVGAARFNRLGTARLNRLGAGGRIPERVRRGLTVEGWIGIGRGDVYWWCGHRKSSGVCLRRCRGVSLRLLGRGRVSRCRVSRCLLSRGLLCRGRIRLSLGGRFGFGLCRGISFELRRRGGIRCSLVSRCLVHLGLRRGRCFRFRLRQRRSLGCGFLGGNRGRIRRGLLGY